MAIGDEIILPDGRRRPLDTDAVSSRATREPDWCEALPVFVRCVSRPGDRRRGPRVDVRGRLFDVMA